MKTNPLLILCAAVAVSLTAVGAESPKPAEKPAPQFPQIELDSKFFTISASAAQRLGLTADLGDSGTKWPGILSAPTYENLLRLLNAEKSVNLLSSPGVTTKSDQRAVVEVIEEFRYPTAFGESGDHLAPAAFVTVNTGISLEVKPVLSPAGDLIDLTVDTSLTEFNRFVTYAEGRTQKSEPIPKGGFSQPVFDRTQNSASVTLRPGQTMLLDGSEWTGAPGLSIRRLMNPGAAKPEGDAKTEAELLFVAVTATLIKGPPPLAGAYGELKTGGPVEITSELVNISRDRLPPGIGGLFTKPPSTGSMGLAGVFEPRQADEIRKILNEASGAQVSVAPPKLIGSHGRYFVEANGFLRYPIERGKIATEQSRGSAVKPETERMNFRLEVKPDAVVDDELNLDIAAVLTTSTAVGEDAGVESAPGIASTHWKFSEDNPPEAARTIWTSVAIWNAQTVLFVRATEARQDHLQILLITVRAPGANGKTPPAENAKPQQWPSASPVPGKPGFVTSPYKPDAGFIDVRGFPKGTEVKDPYTGRMFLVP